MAQAQEHDVLTVTATARPKRVAILIDPVELTLGELDSITQQCMTYWGGAFWPIVPSDGTHITDDWWLVLEAVDPDVVYAVCGLQKPLFDELHRRLAPSTLVDLGTVQAARRDQDFLHLSFFELYAVDAFEVVDYHARNASIIQPARFLNLEDSATDNVDRAFALRNFGLTRRTVATEKAFRSVDVDTRSVDTVSRTDLLAAVIKLPGRPVVPRDLAELYAPRSFDVEYAQPHRGFQLIVGDTLLDVLLAWNRSLTSSRHLGRDFLWIDSESAKDLEFIKAVGEWVRRAFWNNQQQERGAVLSYSEKAEHLDEVAKTLSKAAWMFCKPVVLKPGEFPFRPREPLGRLTYESTFDQSPRVTEHITISETGGLLSIPRPPFLTSVSGQQGWMLDLDVDCLVDHPRSDNRRDTWRLPRRSVLGRLFSDQRQHARIIRSHRPSISVQASERSVPLKVPTKGTLLTYLLEPPPDQAPPGRQARHFPLSRYAHFSTSEQGLRFRALTNLFGGIGSAGRLFGDRFWRSIFLEGSGKPENEIDRLSHLVKRELGPVIEDLKHRITEGETDLSIPARKIAMSLRRARSQPITFTRNQLSARFGQIMKGQVIHTESGPRQIRYADHGDHYLQWLLQIGALQQGNTLTCPTCGTVQWRVVDELAARMRCQDCTAEFFLPADPEWRYRVTGLIQNALVDYGVLSVLHAVHDLTDFAHDLAIAIAPQVLQETYGGPAVTDLDIIVIRDGRFIIGEVKSSAESVDAEQLTVLGAVAREIRPDLVLIAATGKSWPSEVEAEIAKLKSQLSDFHIDVEARLMDW